jgi:hypothetical protein
MAILEIRDSADVALLKHLHRVGIPFGGAWEPQYCIELHMTNDSKLFFEHNELEQMGATFDGMRWNHQSEGAFWPVVGGKNFYQYEIPVFPFRYWVREATAAQLPEVGGLPVVQYPRLAWRDVARCISERTLIATIVPERTFCGHKAPTIRGGYLPHDRVRELCALFNSFVFDWQARIRGGISQSYTLLNGLVAPSRVSELRLTARDRVATEVEVLKAYALPFDLAVHTLESFPLLDRLEPPLEGEDRSTIPRDLVLAGYSESLEHPSARHYRERADRATAIGARPFVPETRAEDTTDVEDDE